jgi:AsmA protein
MKGILKIAAIVVAVCIVIVIAIPFLVNANSFRPKLETELTGALGRTVKVGNLSLSVLSGSVSADDISIADDPQFGQTPFVQAKSLKVGVELMPLIFSKTLNVTELTLNQPEISLVKSPNGEKWNFSSLGAKNAAAANPASQTPTAPNQKPASGAPPAGSNPNLSVAKLNVSDGRLTVSRVGSNDKPKVYDNVNIQVTSFSFASSFPFEMTAQLPAGGSMKLEGKAGPMDANDAARTPLDAKLSIEKMNLAASGFVDPAAGIAGIADLSGTVVSDGHAAKTNVTLKAANLQVVAKGSPAGREVDITLALAHSLEQQTGNITQGDIAMGKAVAHMTGTYDAHGDVTSVNLKLNGQAMPVDDLEAMLPAIGVVLPPKASLKGGTLNTTMEITGPVNKLVITGSVKMENATLANFDLGSKLSTVAALAGKKTGNDTTIQNFSSDVRVAPEGTQANNVNLTVPSIGVLTGNGTVSPSNELAFKMMADVGGLKVPFSVQGTTSDPKVSPDMKGLASGLLKGAIPGKGKNAVQGLTGMFGKKK